MPLRFRLLGDVGVRIDDDIAELGHPRQRVVLAVLLFDVNRTVSVERVIDRVWGDQPPQRAREALYSYLSRLRRVVADLDGVDIVHHSGGYQLIADPDTVDLHRFRSLVAQARQADDDTAAQRFAEALELWDGAPFGNLESPWLDDVRVLLAQERQSAELDRNEVQLRRGHHAELLPELTTRAAEHPTNERLAGQLMRALHAGGRPADALAVFAALRTRLVEELGMDPSPELRQLHQRLLVSGSEVADDTNGSRTPVIPRQLPAPPGVFAGRATELAALDELLAPAEGSRVAVISGVGGLGKTRLALRWAHEHADQFPDGQLYVDLRGFDPVEAPLPAAVALRGFLAALGIPATSVPEDVPARTALYRSRIAGRRILVVLDNARDTEHVTPLLPGSPSCVTVVTSRHRLSALVTSYGARMIQPPLLAPDEAFSVLADALGTARVVAEPAAVAELLTHCDGLPLALTILAARAGAHPDFPIAALAGELRNSADRLDALDGGEAAANLADVFACSYRALDEPTARLFASLGLVRGQDLSTRWAAELIGEPPARARILLRHLETVHLVEQHLPGRYRMHDLVRLYARDQARRTLTEDERTAAVRRMVDACLRDAVAADRVQVPQRAPIELDLPPADCAPPNQTAALTWFDTEYASLRAAQELAVEYGLSERTWQLAWALSSYHARQGRYAEDIAIWRIGHNAAESSGDPAAAALACRFLGRALSRVGQYKEALRHLQRGVQLLTETGDKFGAAHTHRSIAWTFAQLNEVRMALSHASQAAELYQELDAQVWLADAVDLVGWYHGQLGDFELAASECERALALHRKHENIEGEANALTSLGYIALHTGRTDLAIERYTAALAGYRTLGSSAQEAGTLVDLGEVYATTGQTEQATEAWREALELLREQCRTNEAAAIEAKLAALAVDIGTPR